MAFLLVIPAIIPMFMTWGMACGAPGASESVFCGGKGGRTEPHTPAEEMAAGVLILVGAVTLIYALTHMPDPPENKIKKAVLKECAELGVPCKYIYTGYNAMTFELYDGTGGQIHQIEYVTKDKIHIKFIHQHLTDVQREQILGCIEQ